MGLIMNAHVQKGQTKAYKIFVDYAVFSLKVVAWIDFFPRYLKYYDSGNSPQSCSVLIL